MSSGSVTGLVIGLVVLALLIARQLTTRQLRENYRLFLILGVIGIIEFASYLRADSHDDARVMVAVAGSLVLAAVFGVLRALTVRVWREGGQLLIRGSWLTGILWAAALGAHLGYDYLVIGGGKSGNAIGNATILLYLVVSLGIQRFILLTRASRMDAAGQLTG
jgi:hypothetical protein